MFLNRQQQIINLWVVFLLGTIFHTQLALIPLFHGVSVTVHENHETSNLLLILWLMLAFFILPMLAIVSTTFINSKRYRVIHFGLTVFYSIMNLFHVGLDLLVTPIAWYQITLMLFLLIVGLLLNIVSFQWMKEIKYKNKLHTV
ncbi:hypothetical protein [Mastigocoleus sp. MO_188.B34]|uniref:hypothetical protein n=1 Tax=Mastigocoleus sp. MO_188.B34 TaxID=3036635 RepID=UPI00263193D2|nr:hypothetical protein [Mastigocoleus sp. MO_188.B34]MDJ0697485.1 hypothetical protein [Mastigocoleus sp. MO_188.B34]